MNNEKEKISNTLKHLNTKKGIPASQGLFKGISELTGYAAICIFNMQRDIKNSFGVQCMNMIINCSNLFYNAFREQDIDKKLQLIDDLNDETEKLQLLFKILDNNKFIPNKQYENLLQILGYQLLQIRKWQKSINDKMTNKTNSTVVNPR